MLLYNSQILTVNYLEVQYLMHFYFSDEATKKTENQIKAEFLLFFDKMVKRKARFFLLDIRKIENQIDKGFVAWFDKNILPLIKSVKAEKIAWLTTRNFPENTLSSANLDEKFFSLPDKAMQWLTKDAQRKKLSFEDGRKPKPHHRHH